MTVIPCGFDPKEMNALDKNEARKILGLDPQDEVILHLGRMVPRKGADNVIRGFAHYVKATFKKSKLIIVGERAIVPILEKPPRLVDSCKSLRRKALLITSFLPVGAVVKT